MIRWICVRFNSRDRSSIWKVLPSHVSRLRQSKSIGIAMGHGYWNERIWCRNRIYWWSWCVCMWILPCSREFIVSASRCNMLIVLIWLTMVRLIFFIKSTIRPGRGIQSRNFAGNIFRVVLPFQIINVSFVVDLKDRIHEDMWWRYRFSRS